VPSTVTAVPANAQLGASIKLVIWDLDDTFWDGTLSEGPVTLSAANVETLKTLNRRGIVNSICSKNDPDAVRTRLQADALWDEFVFASVSWTPKGQRIAELIENAQLRAVNILFVDDNPQNLEEAAFFSPGLQTADPGILAQLLSLPQCQGKDDRGLTRLAQYRVLEQKLDDRTQSSGSNEAFLRSCQIRVGLFEATADEHDRLLELINRSNQLNYTKRRLQAQQLDAMLADRDTEVKYVRVGDRYGDYGICGVYTLTAGKLDDFVFSCRILDMGVERWLYERLGRPAIEISGDVVTALRDTDAVDWIELGYEPPHSSREIAPGATVMLKGGCDLHPVHDFLGGSMKTEFSYNGVTGANVQGHHTEILRRCGDETLERYGSVIDRLPFLDRDAYRSRIVSDPEEFASVVYSVLMDYTQGLYRFNGTDFVIPQGQFTEDITDQALWPEIERLYGSVGFDPAFLSWFAQNFTFEGALTPDALQANVRWLAGLLPATCRLVVLNGAEVEVSHPREPARHLHHTEMNAALDAVIAELPNATLVDVRLIICQRDDVADNIRHYPRRVHMQMADAIRVAVGSRLEVDTRPFVYRSRNVSRRLVRGGTRRARRLVGRIKPSA
jgi:FkbH-like protein